MSESSGHRWSKFWWQDWAGDEALANCSLAAQGLWMRLLCIMHKAMPRGHLLINGRPPTAQELAKATGASLKELDKLLRELSAAGVYSHDLSGVVFSRRMVRDTAASERGRQTGKAGGNPALTRRTNGQGPTQGVNPPTLTPPLNPYPLTPPVKAKEPQGLTPPVNLEAEADSEVESKKESEDRTDNLLSFPIPAREASPEMAPEKPQRSDFDRDLDKLRDAPADAAAAQNAWRKAVEKLDGKQGERSARALYKPPKRSRLQQSVEVIRGEEVYEPGIDTSQARPQPRDAERTPAEQYAQLKGVSLAEAEAMFGGRAA